MLRAVADSTGVDGDPIATAAAIRAEAADAFSVAAGAAGTAGGLLRSEDRAALLGYLVLARLGAMAPGADVAATSLAWYDELRLAPVLEAGLRSAGLDDGVARSVAETVSALLALPRPSQFRGRGRTRDLRLLDQWLAREPVRKALGVNAWQDAEWLDRDRLASLLGWAVRLDAIETGAAPDAGLVDRLMAAAATGGYRVDRLRAALSEPAPKPAKKRPVRRRGS